MPVRIYTPVEAEAYGLLVYFHGGAFFLGSLDTHDHVARSLAKETGLQGRLRRLPPARPRPRSRRACEDCYARRPLGGRAAATAWAGTAGPWRSPATAPAARSSPPSPRWPTTTGSTPSPTRCSTTRRSTWTSTSTATPRCARTPSGYGLETAGLKPFNAFYLDSGADPADPLVSPIKRADLAGLPPALIITAEHDPLRDEGELYGERLREAGVDATVSRYAGAGHGFVQHFSWLPEYHRAFAETRDFLTGREPMASDPPLVSPWGRFGLYSYFIDAPEPAIVDTGIASSPAEGMAPALEALGRRIEDVRWILLTHGHIDHVGGAHALWELTGRRAQVVIHEADAPLLRSRRAHVAGVPGRARRSTCAIPRARRSRPRWPRRAISGEMEPTMLVRGGETISLGGDVTVSVHADPGPHARARSPTSSTARTTCSSATPCRCTARPTGSPATRTRDAYRASLEHLRDDVRPRHLYLGHPYRHADGVPYGVELDREQARAALQESLGHRGPHRRGRARCLADGLRETDSPYSPFAGSPRSSATPATPRSSRPRSSPRCTATARSCDDHG